MPALRIESVAAGGHCVAHTSDRRTVFVRGSLPGELVDAVVEAESQGGRVLFARTDVVREPSTERVVPPCRYAGECGGCDFQHAEPGFQRELKAQVFVDQLSRIGHVTEVGGVPLAAAVAVRPAGDGDGLRWRTRVSAAVVDGRAGFHAHRSDRVVPVDDCPVVTEEVAPVFGRDWPGVSAVIAATGDPGGFTVEPETAGGALGPAGDLRERAWVRRMALGREWRVATDGFWQAHYAAPELLVGAVRQVLQPKSDDHLLDLYSGVGLFAGVLASEVASVDAVEGDGRAVKMARRNLHDLSTVSIHHSPVGDWLAARTSTEEARRPDLIVLDPPRVGAGAGIVNAIDALGPRRVAYVACDGAALARDLRHFGDLGWQLDSLSCFDIFPMTAHVEAVAGLSAPSSE